MNRLSPSQFEEIQHFAREQLGFLDLAWAPTVRPETHSNYIDWLTKGWHGDMDYLEKSKDSKESLKNILQDCQGIFVLTALYESKSTEDSAVLEESKEFKSETARKQDPSAPTRGLKIARYARQKDYHLWIPEKLKILSDRIREFAPDAEFEWATDSIPILERDFARQAGLGWVGKNTCLIHPQHGSYFFIAEVLSNVSVQLSSGPTPLPDFCGTCSRCIDACPTGALESQRGLNANLCISYLTIETKTLPPDQLRSQMGGHFFGCDICQDACPWNQKVFGRERIKAELEEPPVANEATIASLRFYLTASNREIESALKESPMLRARPFGLRRNAILVAGNLKVSELEAEIQALRRHESLVPLVEWYMEQIY